MMEDGGTIKINDETWWNRHIIGNGTDISLVMEQADY